VPLVAVLPLPLLLLPSSGAISARKSGCETLKRPQLDWTRTRKDWKIGGLENVREMSIRGEYNPGTKFNSKVTIFDSHLASYILHAREDMTKYS
jgi:hypothetical protein